MHLQIANREFNCIWHCFYCAAVVSKEKYYSSMKKLIYVTVGLMAAQFTAHGQKLETRQDSVSYAMGVTLAESLKRTGVTEYDQDILAKALKDALNGKSTISLSDAEAIQRAEAKKQKEQQAQKNKEAGEKFLAQNAKKPNMKITASGIQYEVITEGTGEHPDANDNVTVHYHGTLIDGTVFDSSVERKQNISFDLNRVIAGWTEGVQLMKPGSKYRFYIPAHLAYGTNGQGKIGPNSVLIFEIELFSFTRK
ncbi:MAG: FKBP-type peptidyl-prolyl cis-trans isomerase [Bacteroidota bacterium]